MQGKLFLVATPIGNLKDITLRALETLQTVDLIAAEDTRHSAILLKHYQIKTPKVSYHSYNERNMTNRLIALLKEGKHIALITDAGTPGISDPAFSLVRAAIENDLQIETLPGPTALIPALILSGLPSHRFTFEGFPPKKKGRKTFFNALMTEQRTIILYESPYRVVRTLENILAEWGDRNVALVREITKMYEEVLRGKVSYLLTTLSERSLKGECVLVIEGVDTKFLKSHQF